MLKRCVTCRRLEGLPYSSYNVPDLPSVRVFEDPPFTHSGVDFVGPLFVRGKSTTESDNNKCYVCLFTSAATRAVHLELTPNLTVKSFLLAFRRFTSRRGLPATLMSDNGKTFRGSSKEIVKIARSKEVLHYLAINGVSCREGPLVGRLLGEINPERQAMYEKVPWLNHLILRRVKHLAC